jgi:threonine dehydrogenase-like Zn-dependent dehydrogenase
MDAIRFNLTIPRYLVGRSLGRVFPSILWNGLTCTAFQQVSELDLLGPDWVKIRTRYGGICGSDLSAIYLTASPYYEPFSSPEFTFGHENVGRIVEVGAAIEGWGVGERVVVEPTLWCEPRGFQDLCSFCARGEVNLCERVSDGSLSPAPMIGFNVETGGSWSQFFLAHKSQLFKVPDNVTDENALLIEPFSVGLHAALLSFPTDDQTVLIIGSGTIGLMTLAALRGLGSKARILVLARYPFQAEAALKLGATQVIPAGRGVDYSGEVARATGGRLLKPLIGKRVMVGGADLTFECVGKDATLDDALRFTRAGGRVTLVGVPGLAKNVDWAALFDNELTVKGAYIYNHAETYQGARIKTYQLALDLMASGEVDLAWMITHRFALKEYRKVFEMLRARGRYKIIKGVFEFQDQD